jgi:hypothetical protein
LIDTGAASDDNSGIIMTMTSAPGAEVGLKERTRFLSQGACAPGQLADVSLMLKAITEEDPKSRRIQTSPTRIAAEAKHQLVLTSLQNWSEHGPSFVTEPIQQSPDQEVVFPPVSPQTSIPNPEGGEDLLLKDFALARTIRLVAPIMSKPRAPLSKTRQKIRLNTATVGNVLNQMGISRS